MAMDLMLHCYIWRTIIDFGPRSNIDIEKSLSAKNYQNKIIMVIIIIIIT